MVMPSLESLTLQQREQIETLPVPELSQPESRAGGRLASSTPADPRNQPDPSYQADPRYQAGPSYQADPRYQAGPSFQALSTPQPEVREHHWIQQP